MPSLRACSLSIWVVPLPAGVVWAHNRKPHVRILALDQGERTYQFEMPLSGEKTRHAHNEWCTIRHAKRCAPWRRIERWIPNVTVRSR